MRSHDYCGIYCIENIVTNKKYIGQSVKIFTRWCQHKSELKNGVHFNDYLQKSWNKYGECNFSFYILECCNDYELDAKEKYYISLYNTDNRDFGYNLKSGGQNDAKLSPESLIKLSNSLKAYYMVNSDAKKRQSKNALKQWAIPEIKEKIIGSNNGMYGKHHTDEVKKKISKINSGRISSQRILTPVICVELNKIFSCAADAAKELGIHSSLILQVCYGKRKTTGGYHWNFITENN